MKHFAEAGIVLEPRTAGECLDLAFRFVGREWVWVGGMVLSCALPAVAVTWWGAQAGPFGWLIATGCLAWFSIPLGSLLVTYAAALAFREPLTLSRMGYQAFWKSWPALLMKGVVRLPVLGLACLIIPSLMLLTLGGFQTESRILSQYRAQSHEHRTQDLIRRSYSDLLLRMGQMLLFGVLLWIILTLTADAACTLLFDLSPVFGPLGAAAQDPWGFLDFEDVFMKVCYAAFTEPSVLATCVATALVTYAILRLAWFFTYVDLRIRDDCWDLEFALSAEAERWETRR